MHSLLIGKSIDFNLALKVWIFLYMARFEPGCYIEMAKSENVIRVRFGAPGPKSVLENGGRPLDETPSIPFSTLKRSATIHFNYEN